MLLVLNTETMSRPNLPHYCVLCNIHNGKYIPKTHIFTCSKWTPRQIEFRLVLMLSCPLRRWKKCPVDWGFSLWSKWGVTEITVTWMYIFFCFAFTGIHVYNLLPLTSFLCLLSPSRQTSNTFMTLNVLKEEEHTHTVLIISFTLRHNVYRMCRICFR